MADNTNVRVAVRVRPLVHSEISRGCKEILDVVQANEQIIVRSFDREDKAFTFNYVLSGKASQEELYGRCVQPLIQNIFNGYNVTILAYGQTGSGKTHSMGTVYNENSQDMGVIPRAVKEIFNFVRENFSYTFTITVSFLELYQETLYDLLSGKPRDQCILEIREDATKGIYIPRLTEVPVDSVEDVLNMLQKGSAIRVTGATNMNMHSSRSHSIFVVNIAMNHKTNCRENKQAKLNLVDLAGSERPKKTGAIGETFKEGVNINKGLFVLGNVISALGDDKNQNGFIPYRDSNLTRLLKDSLGGNSITLMIACVSPADYNLEETLSTLRYADRARKIKNKPIVNQDPKVAEINDLKKTIQLLKLQIVGQGGPVICPAEMEILKKELSETKMKIKDLNDQLTTTLVEKTGLHEKVILLQNNNEMLQKKLIDLKDQYSVVLNIINSGIGETNGGELKDKLMIIQKQFEDIQDEQRKANEEIRIHESSFNQLLINNNTIVTEELDEKQQLHANRQIDLNMQLTELQKQLVLKEGLAKQLLTNHQHIIDYEAISENESKIAKLEREKEELLQILEKFGNDKMAGQRKKRIEELEQQLVQLKKKLQEQNNLIKLKAKDAERINRLNSEIVQMKQAKVKLVRMMKEESEKFRKWKLQKEREYQKLKRQDLKKDNEIIKMKVMHTKQQNVFKRRVEEAEALNKRLKGILNMRNQVQNVKNDENAHKLDQWMKDECELHINLVEAETMLKQLLEDRGVLQKQLEELRSNPETASSQECKNVAEDLEVRSVQIQELQQKLLDSNEESKSKPRFDRLQSMGAAKYCLKFLFSKMTEVVQEKTLLQAKFNDLKDSLDEAHEKCRVLEAQQKQLEESHAQSLIAVEQSYEEKTAILLRQLRDTFSESDQKNEKEMLYQIQQERIDAQENKIQQLLNENEILKTRIEHIQKVAEKQTFVTPKTAVKFPVACEEIKSVPSLQFDSSDEENDKEDIVQKPPKKIQKVENEREDWNQMEVLDSPGFDELDDPINDPDWKKTPLGKKIVEAKRRIAKPLLELNKKAIKRSLEGGCTCKTGCATGKCGCKKTNKICDSGCRCASGTCVNRSSDLQEIEASADMAEKT